MLRVFSSTSAVAATSCATSKLAATSVAVMAARGGFQYYSPKADIHMDKFTMNDCFTNMHNKSGRAPNDYDISKYRKMYYRVDELCRRQERHVQGQGYFFLPPLDFPSYRGCMPLYTPEQLRLHYGRHHRAYVTKLNDLIAGSRFQGLPLDEIIRKTDGDREFTAIFNNAAQHFNHMFFWKSIKPFGVNMPPELQAALEAQFGSMDELKALMTAKAMGHFGSGWLWLTYNKNTVEFDVFTTSNADTPLTMQGQVPMLTMDLWEHSWANDYENVKADYVANYFKVCDWHWAERHWKRGQGKEYNDMVWN